MNYLLLFYYLFSLLTGSVAVFLSYLAYRKYKNKVSVIHFFFQISLFLFILTHTIYFYFHIIKFNFFNYVYLFNQIYIILDSFLCYSVPLLALYLSKKKVENIFERIFLFFPFSGVLLVIEILLFRLNENFQEKVILFYSYLLILIIVSSLMFLVVSLKNQKEEFLRKLIKKIIIVVLLFIPGFIVDANFDLFQNRLKIIPKLFNFLGIFYIVWNIFTIYYSFIFIDKVVDKKGIIEITDDFIRYYKITEREKELLSLIVNGLTNKEIAKRMFLSEGTVKNYIYYLFQKLNVSTRTEIVKKIAEFNESEKNF